MAGYIESSRLVSVEAPKPEFSIYLKPVIQSAQLRNDWMRWMNDPHISKWMYSDQLYTPEEIYRWVYNATHDPRRHYFSIEADDGKSIGFVSLRQDHAPSTSAEIGIVIGEKDYWGRGVGKKVVEQTLGLAKDTLHLSTVRAMIKPDNARSIALFTTSGFHEVARVSVEGVAMVRFEKNLS